MTYRNWRIVCWMTFACLACAIQARQQRNLGDIGFAMDVIEHSYVDSVDREKLYRAAMSGMIDSLDTYSGYIAPEQYGTFQSQIHQEFGGLGIVIERPKKGEHLKIVSVLYDSPAAKAGVLSGDEIERIGERSAIGLATDEATKLLRGPPGSEVLLTVARGTDRELFRIKIRRAIIETESVTGDRRLPDGRWDFMMQADPRFAYIRIEIFGEKTTAELREALASVRGRAQGVLLDLRDNAGGLLPTAVDVCDMFLEKGTIVSTSGRHEHFETTRIATPGVEVQDSIPLFVLVNHQSASASEVTAACLQDHGRATILGERTFGKGSVQNVIELEGGKAALRLTSAHYFPPSGRNIHRRSDSKEEDEWGVHPDPGFEVELDEEKTIHVFERLRDRGNPLAHQELRQEEAAADARSKAAQQAIDRDPSIAKDPQLLRAIEALDQRLMVPTAP